MSLGYTSSSCHRQSRLHSPSVTWQRLPKLGRIGAVSSSSCSRQFFGKKPSNMSQKQQMLPASVITHGLLQSQRDFRSVLLSLYIVSYLTPRSSSLLLLLSPTTTIIIIIIIRIISTGISWYCNYQAYHNKGQALEKPRSQAVTEASAVGRSKFSSGKTCIIPCHSIVR